MTKNQIRTFWPRFAETCRELGLESKEEREEYRLSVMRDEAHAEHLKDVSSTTGYESVMTRLAADAGDLEAASRYVIGDDRRRAAMLDDCARQVFELSGKTGDRASYARSILSQSGVESPPNQFADWWKDYPESAYMRVFYSLDTHRRRLIRRRISETGKRLPVRYVFGRVWS